MSAISFVQWSDDTLPLQAVPGYTAWWDASQITGVTDGATLTSWPDQSGHGWNLAPAGAGAGVYYNTTGRKLINRRPAVWFTPNQWMSVNSFPRQQLPMVVQMAAQIMDNSTQRFWWTGGAQCGFNPPDYWVQDGTNRATVGTVNGNVHVLTFVVNAAGGTEYVAVDGVPGATAVVASPVSTAGTSYLASDGTSTGTMTGPICEVLIYTNSTLSAGQIAANENYLTQKWIAPPLTAMAWYDASAITGVSDGSGLALWPDQSGNAYDFAQPTGANQPVYHSSLVNSQPAVTFNGSQYMSIVSAAAPVRLQPYTVVAVAAATSTTLNTSLFFTATNGINLYHSFPGQWAIFGGSSSVQSTDNAGTGLHFVAAVYDGAVSAIQTDGHYAVLASSPGTKGLGGQAYLGWDTVAGEQYIGTLCELLVYGGALTFADINTLRSYAQAKWATP